MPTFVDGVEVNDLFVDANEIDEAFADGVEVFSSGPVIIVDDIAVFISPENGNFFSMADDGAGIIVVCGGAGPNEQENWIYRSLNSGVNWARVHTGDGGALRSVAYHNGLFVAVGGSRTGTVADNGRIYTSPDGTTWTKRETGLPEFAELYNVYWFSIGNAWLVSGRQGNNEVLFRSTDGISWTRVQLSGGGVPCFSCRCIAISEPDSLLTMVGENLAGGTFRTSSDGINWTDPFTASIVAYPSGMVDIAYIESQDVFYSLGSSLNCWIHPNSDGFPSAGQDTGVPGIGQLSSRIRAIKDGTNVFIPSFENCTTGLDGEYNTYQYTSGYLQSNVYEDGEGNLWSIGQAIVQLLT